MLRIVCKRCPFEFRTKLISRPDIERLGAHLAKEHPEARGNLSDNVALIFRNATILDPDEGK